MSSFPKLRPISSPLARTVAGEIQGTFLLAALIVLVTTSVTDLHQAATGIALSLVPLVYCLGYVSGAFYNPAVVTGVFLLFLNRQVKPWKELAKEWLIINTAIVVSALAGAWTGAYLVGNETTLKEKMAQIKPSSTAPGSIGRALVGEFIFTFFLVSVILHCGFNKKYGSPSQGGSGGNSFYGLAIGFTVFAGIHCIGPISGAALNPAMSIAMSLTRCSPMVGWECSSIGYLWLYQLAGHTAGIFATLCFVLMSNEEVTCVEEEKRLVREKLDLERKANSCCPDSSVPCVNGASMVPNHGAEEDGVGCLPFGRDENDGPEEGAEMVSTSGDRAPLVIPCGSGSRLVHLKCK